MNKVVHLAESRGKADHGWLKSRFSFSFADWHDPARMGFGALRVINDDIIAPKSGFELHAHRDMEIITIVTAGAVTHEDSMGNREDIKAGEVQVMTAGTGVTHSEYNHKSEPLTLFQIWIMPRMRALSPRYAQWDFSSPIAGASQLLVSPDGEGESLLINQDAYISRLTVIMGAEVIYQIMHPGNGAYIFVISGEVSIAGERLGARDAIGVSEINQITIISSSETELLVIEVPL